MPLLRIEVLGSFRWSLGDHVLPPPTPVGVAALSYLLVHAGETIRHEEMEALFTLLAPHSADDWTVEAQRLARYVPRPLLRVTSHSIRLTREVKSDLGEVGSLLDGPSTPEGLQRAWLLLRSEFLEGLTLKNRPIWNVWLRARRTRLRKHLEFVTEQLRMSAIIPIVQRGGSSAPEHSVH
jgi:hypothetical protein